MNNFTPRAQQVLQLARKEADRFNHNYVGTEHLLLGLIKLGQGVAVNVLQKMGLDLETVRMEVEKQVGSGPETKIVGNIPYTPRVKKVLALAGKEAKEENPWHATTLEWSIPSPPPHDNFGGLEPVVYHGPYEFSVPGAADDYIPQHLAPNLVRKA